MAVAALSAGSRSAVLAETPVTEATRPFGNLADIERILAEFRKMVPADSLGSSFTGKREASERKPPSCHEPGRKPGPHNGNEHWIIHVALRRLQLKTRALYPYWPRLTRGFVRVSDGAVSVTSQ